MTSADIQSVLNGCWLHYNGKANLKKYRFKTKPMERVSQSWLCDFVLTHDDAILLGALLAYQNKWWVTLEKEDAKFILEEAKSFLEKPSCIIHELELESKVDLINLVKEGINGSHLLSLFKGRKVNPISFLVICGLTNCNKSWTSIHWRIIKDKADRLGDMIEIPDSHLIRIAKFLSKKFSETC